MKSPNMIVLKPALSSSAAIKGGRAVLLANSIDYWVN
jgi:hypothetical protein